MAGLPWNNIGYLAEGHTVNFAGLPRADLNMVLFTSHLSAFPNVDLGDYRGSRVLFLWAVPVTDRERSVTMEGVLRRCWLVLGVWGRVFLRYSVDCL